MASRSSAKSKSSARREARPSDHPQLFAATEESQESGALRVMYRLPERFEAFSDPQQGMVVIKDTQSGKKVPVAIGAYGEVRRLLGALFGGDVEEVTDFVPPAVEPLSAEQIESFEAAESEAAETARLAAEVRETKAPAPPPFPPETIADIPPPPKKLFGAALKSYYERMMRAREEDQATDAAAVAAASPAPAPAPAAMAKAEKPKAGKAGKGSAAKAPEPAASEPAAPVAAPAADIPPPPKKLFGAALKAYEAKMRRAQDETPAAAETEPPAAPAAAETPAAPAVKPAKKGKATGTRIIAAVPDQAAAIAGESTDQVAAAVAPLVAEAAPEPVAAPAPKATTDKKAPAPAKANAPTAGAGGKSKAASAKAPVPTPAAKTAAKKAPAPASAAKPGAIPPGFEAMIEGQNYVMEYGQDPETGSPAYRILVRGNVVGWLREEAPKRFVMYSPDEAFDRSVHRNVLGAQTRLDVMYENVSA